MNRKKKAGMLVLIAVLLVFAPLAQGLGSQQGCEEDYRDENDCRVNYQAEVKVRRSFHVSDFMADFTMGFLFGPFSLVTSFCCGEREVSGCEWEDPKYKRKEKYRNTCKTKTRNQEVLNKLTGWGASILTFFALESICC